LAQAFERNNYYFCMLCSKMGQSECFPAVQAREPAKSLGMQGKRNLQSASFVNVPSNQLGRDLPEMKGSKFASFTNGANVPNETTSQVESEGPSTPSSFVNNASEESKDEQIEWVEPKEQDDFRMSYLHRLSYEKVWVPPAKRTPQHQTVIIFDWDDTLLCTSYLNQHDGDSGPSPATQQHLQAIESKAKELLQLAIRLGHTFIITNAMEGWVEYSAAKWVPALLPLLEKVEIISARSRYEALYPNDVRQWKIHAFRDLQRELDLPIITNLNSIGDANYEMEATQIMGKEFSEALVKTIKLRENPSPIELLKQLELVTQKFEGIVTNARNLKVSLERKLVASPPKPLA